MRLSRATLLLLALSAAPPAAAAEEVPGIDLSEPEEPARAPPAPPDGAAPPEARDEAAPLGPALGAPEGERDAALADRVKAVQRRGFLKRGRWEVGLSVPATVNDAFYQKVGLGGRVAYHFRESFALALRGQGYWDIRTEHVREGKIAFSSQVLSSQIDRQLTLDAIWSPVYGKVAWLGRRIIHFDLFLLAGFGGAWTATSGAPRNLGPHPAADVGGGLRFYPADWLALEAGLHATFYPDQPTTSAPSTMQRVVAANLGVSFFFPLHFEYHHP